MNIAAILTSAEETEHCQLRKKKKKKQDKKEEKNTVEHTEEKEKEEQRSDVQCTICAYM